MTARLSSIFAGANIALQGVFARHWDARHQLSCDIAAETAGCGDAAGEDVKHQ